MRMETSLQQRPELRLKLAPQIIQSIEILQLATLDLKSLIEREMEMNPTIEIENAEPAANDTVAPQPVAIGAEGGEAPTIASPTPADTNAPDQLESEFERLDGLNEAWKEFSGSYRPTMSADGKDKKLEAMQNTADRTDSLQKHLESQFTVLELTERELEIGDYLIYNIDDNGYLRFQLNPEFLDASGIEPKVV